MWSSFSWDSDITTGSSLGHVSHTRLSNVMDKLVVVSLGRSFEYLTSIGFLVWIVNVQLLSNFSLFSELGHMQRCKKNSLLH